MQNFTKNFLEINKELRKLKVFNLVLNSLVIFLVSAVILKFLNFSAILGIFPAIFYFVQRFTHRITDKKTLENIAEKYPSLEEKLKTAYDNKESMKNLLVRKLLQETSEDLDNIEESKFLDNREIAKKFLFVILLTFILLSITIISFGIHKLGYDPYDILGSIDSMRKGIIPGKITPGGESTSEEWEKGNYSNEKEKERLGGEGGGKIPGFSKGPIPGIGGGAGTVPDEEIFGEARSAKISGEEIAMRVHPEYGGEIEIKEEGRKGKIEKFSIEEAKGAEIPSSEPLEYEEIIKRYFEKLLEEEGKK